MSEIHINDEDYVWVSSGWCSQCGFYISRGEHVCPDGTKPMVWYPGGLTKDDMKALYEDGKMT